MTEREDASVRTVVVAVAANLLVAVAKGVAAALTGSAAMLAETTQSIAGTCNELLLYVGVRRGMRRPTTAIPWATGRPASSGRCWRPSGSSSSPGCSIGVAYVVPVEGADLLGGVGELRRRLLSLPAVTAVEVTPVERAI